MKITGSLPDKVALEELGRRAKRARVERNLTQTDLAAAAGVSPSTIERFEAGKQTQLGNVLRILRPLKMFDSLDRLLPETSVRPMDYLQGKTAGRQRASASRLSRATQPTTWGNKK